MADNDEIEIESERSIELMKMKVTPLPKHLQSKRRGSLPNMIVNQKNRNSRRGSLPEVDLHKKHLLFVEDNPVMGMVGKAMFTKLGYKVIVAKNGKEAVEEVKNSPLLERRLSFVVMDKNMPEMEGDEATRLIRTLPNGRDIPIYGLTASTIEERNNLLDAGANDVFIKPLTKEMAYQMKIMSEDYDQSLSE